MKHLAALAVLGCMTALVTGQAKHRSSGPSPCTMTTAQLREIRGLRLGMSVSNLLAAFPEESSKNSIQKAVGDARKPDAYGFGRATLFRSNPAVNPNFSGVPFIELELVDEHVSLFRVNYERGTPWKSADQFVDRLSDEFHLPDSQHWKRLDTIGRPYKDSSKIDYGVRTLTCNGFTVLATTNNGNGGSAVIVKNPKAEEVVKNREEAAKEKIRQAFKP